LRFIRYPTISALIVLFFLIANINALSDRFTQANVNGENTPPDQHVDIHLEFDSSSARELTYNGFSYVTAPGYYIPFTEGDAALPFTIRKVLVHPLAENIRLHITNIEERTISVDHPVAGVPEPSPVSSSVPSPAGPPLEYPPEHLSVSGDGYVRGMKVLDIRFDPIILDGRGALTSASEIDARLTYDIPEEIQVDLGAPFRRSTSVFRSSLEHDLLNPEDIDRFPALKMDAPVSILDHGDVQYVVITNTSLIGDAFSPFIEWKNRKGIPTKLVETSFINDNYNGTDMAEKIRNFIKDAVNSWDTEFVLLGGDVAVVDYRGAYARTSGTTQPYNACDLYFSDLDGTWNQDGDSYWGETTDGVDLRPDVYVGRAPVQTYQEAKVFVNKTMIYEISPPSGYLDNATLAGEYLDSTTNSSQGMDLIKNNLLPSTMNATSMYDSAKGVFGNLNRPNFMNQVDMGASLIYHSGHCNWNVMSVGTASNGMMYNSNIPLYKSDAKYGVLNTIGCIANRFNNNDAIVERHVLEPDGGTIAGIGNSHYGWYSYGYPGFGPSEQFMYVMTYELFRNGQVRMAQHFAEGKNYFVSSSGSYNSARWIQIVLNLLGDPEVRVRTSEPGVMNVTFPSTVGMSYEGLPVKVSYANGTPIKDALVCLQKSDYYSYALTNETGEARFNFTTSNLDPLNVTITALNQLPFTVNLSVDNVLPTIHLDLSEPGTTGEDYSVNCTILDDAGIKEAYLEVNGSLGRTVLKGNGTVFTTNISIPVNSIEPLELRILAMDGSGNWNITPWMDLLVNDNDPPYLIEDRTGRFAETGDPHNFSLRASDNIGVGNVSVRFAPPGEGYRTSEMFIVDDVWSFTITAPWNRTGRMEYSFCIYDTSGNARRTDSSFLSILDDDRPTFIRDLTNRTAGTSDPISLEVDVLDNIAVESVHAEYWYDNWPIHDNKSMEPVKGLFEFTIMAPESDLEPLHYRFHAVDSSGNVNSSDIGTVTIIDDDPPVFGTDRTPGEIEAGGKLSFNINVHDNVEISKVKLFWDQGNTGEKEVILVPGSQDIYGFMMDVRSDSTDPISYRCMARDSSGNENWSRNRTITVLDSIKPTIDDIDVPSSVDAGSTLNVSCRVSDNIRVSRVCVTWWFGGGEKKESEMEYMNGSFIFSLPVSLEAYGTLYLSFKARDNSDNIAVSSREEILIIEHVPEEETDEGEERHPLPGEDLDADGMEDLWEYQHGLDIGINDSFMDQDEDGFSNIEEYLSGTDPHNPLSFPSTGNGDNGRSPWIALLLIAALLLLLLASGVLFIILVRSKRVEPPKPVGAHPHAVHPHFHDEKHRQADAPKHPHANGSHGHDDTHTNSIHHHHAHDHMPVHSTHQSTSQLASLDIADNIHQR